MYKSASKFQKRDAFTTRKILKVKLQNSTPKKTEEVSLENLENIKNKIDRAKNELISIKRKQRRKLQHKIITELEQNFIDIQEKFTEKIVVQKRYKTSKVKVS